LFCNRTHRPNERETHNATISAAAKNNTNSGTPRIRVACRLDGPGAGLEGAEGAAVTFDGISW
jgi:hypothetical protein